MNFPTHLPNQNWWEHLHYTTCFWLIITNFSTLNSFLSLLAITAITITANSHFYLSLLSLTVMFHYYRSIVNTRHMLVNCHLWLINCELWLVPYIAGILLPHIQSNSTLSSVSSVTANKFISRCLSLGQV